MAKRKKVLELADKPMMYGRVDDVTEEADCVLIPLLPLGDQVFLVKVLKQIEALLARGWRFDHCRDYLQKHLKPKAFRELERKYLSTPVVEDVLGGQGPEGEIPTALVPSVRRYGLDPLPASKTHRFRMNLKSESSNRLYVVSQRRSTGGWECSCPGWTMSGQRSCKHLRAMAPVLNAPEFRQGMEK